MPSSAPRPNSVTVVQPDRPAVVDEWGFYDPEQAGLAALFDRVAEKLGAGDPDADQIRVSMRDTSGLADADARLDDRFGYDDE